MREKYINISYNSQLNDVLQWLIQATREREFDLEDFENQITTNPVIYPVPSSSSDLIGTEKVGDISADASYFYIVVDDSGLTWKRVAISSF